MRNVEHKTEANRPERPSRRDALRRLAGAVVAAYVVPEVLFLSEAKAGDGPSGAQTDPSGPDPIEPPDDGNDGGEDDDGGPEDTGGGGSDDDDNGSGDRGDKSEDSARDTCNIPGTQNANTISISRSDMQRSQEAIDAGYAKPLNQIWGNFISDYDGKVIGVEFLDRQNNPRYRFRAISKSGRLETVTISAQTGAIQQIVGC